MKQFNLLFLAAVLLLFSCETEKIETEKIEIQNVTNNDLDGINAQINLENILDEVEYILDNITISNSDFNSKSFHSNVDKNAINDTIVLENCMDISITQTAMSRIFTLTFNGECEDSAGNTITGTIVKTIPLGEETSENTMEIKNFTINARTINGTRNQTTTSNANGNSEMSGTVDLSVITEIGTFSRAGTRTVEVFAGADTATYMDDVNIITASYTYTGLKETFEVRTTTSLVKPVNCNFTVSGIKTYTNSEGTITLNYGNGACDDVANATLSDGSEREIILGTFNGNGEGTSIKQCTITTDCEEVVVTNTSDVSVQINQVDGVYVIVAKNQDGEVVYEASCEKGGTVAVSCSSRG